MSYCSSSYPITRIEIPVFRLQEIKHSSSSSSSSSLSLKLSSVCVSRASKMLSLAIQPTFSTSASFKPSALSYHTPKLVAEIPFKSSISARPKGTSFQSSTLSNVEANRVARRNAKPSTSSAAAVDAVAEETPAENSTPSTQLEKEKLGVIVKPMQRPRLVLKFIWMEKNIGLGLNQVIPGHGTIPLSPYYFWPRKDAWEELKVLLESKPWISQKQMIILLNQATDIINLWQQSGGDLS